MRAVANLGRLDRLARRKLGILGRRAGRLVTGFDGAGLTLSAHLREAELSLLTIGLQSFWSNWCRAYYLSCAVGTRTTRGNVVSNSAGITSFNEAMAMAIQITRGSKVPPNAWRPHEEPKWFDPNVLLLIAKGAALTNEPHIAAILGTIPLTFSHLRTMRNYFAHRGEDLRRDALSISPFYLYGRPDNPSNILVHIETGRTRCVVERWTIDLERIARALCT